MILSQTQRRKRVTSLYKLSILKLSSNHNLLRDINNLSLYYHLIKPILFKLSKQQLFNLEQRDPNLIDLTEEIWYQLLIKRFPHETLLDDTSRNRYLQLEQEQELKRQSLINKLRLHTKELEKKKTIDQIEVIDHHHSLPPGGGGGGGVSRLQFKSSILQKINKECSIKEKKFNHDVRFNHIISPRKRPFPQQQQQQQQEQQQVVLKKSKTNNNNIINNSDSKIETTKLTAAHHHNNNNNEKNEIMKIKKKSPTPLQSSSQPSSRVRSSNQETSTMVRPTLSINTKTSSSSIFIPRSRPTLLSPSTVPKKKKIKKLKLQSQQEQQQQQQQQQQQHNKRIKKSSIFIALAGGVRGQ